MSNKEVIEGLKILNKYCKEDSHNIWVSNETIWFNATDKELEDDDVKELIELGWFQEDVHYDNEFRLRHYDPDEAWTYYV